jgi:GNAT superfamily N-acetyltransferase
MTYDIKHFHNVIGVTIRAYDGEKQIGFLFLTGEFAHADNARFVRNVSVDEAYRRQGVATQLWEYAKANGFNPTHDLVKSDDGVAWSTKVGA